MQVVAATACNACAELILLFLAAVNILVPCSALHSCGTNLLIHHSCQHSLLFPTSLGSANRHHDCLVPLQQATNATERADLAQSVAQALIVLAANASFSPRPPLTARVRYIAS